MNESQQPDYGSRAGDIRPVPDPTRLTSEAVEAATRTLKEMLLAGLLTQEKIFGTRLDGMDKAIVLLQETANKSPTIAVVDANVKRLEDVTNERFIGVRQKFEDLFATIAQASVKDAKAVDAAFSAQKEAVAEQNKSNAQSVAKTEATFTKQIDQLGILVDEKAKGTEGTLDGIKTRLTLIEGQKKGSEASFGLVAGLATMAVMMGMLVVAIIGLYLKTQ